jgi:general stress protein 26
MPPSRPALAILGLALLAFAFAAAPVLAEPPASSSPAAPSPAAVSAAAASPSAVTPDRATLLAAAREVMQTARYCAFVTFGPDGRAQARAVDAFAPEQDMTVWVATKPATRKVAEVRKDPRVTLYYYEPKGPGYVTLLGDAQVVDDPAEKAKRWKEEWASFYSDRNRGADYVLLRVRPRRLEVVSYGKGLLGDPVTWRPFEVVFD